jgi:hypothetical protein
MAASSTTVELPAAVLQVAHVTPVFCSCGSSVPVPLLCPDAAGYSSVEQAVRGAGVSMQTQEARTEALHLMGSLHNLQTPKNGEVLICANQVCAPTPLLLARCSVLFCSRVAQASS